MRKHIFILAASLALAQLSSGAFAQQTATAAWAGWARCQISVQGPGYTDQQTHTWTISGGAPTAQGAFQVYAGTWSVVGGGSLSRTQGTQTLMAQWATNGPDISAPIAVFVRASDKRMFIQSRHAQLRSAAAIQGYQQVTISGKPQTPGKIAAEAFEWTFPVIAVSAPVPPDTNATANGSSTSPVTGSVGPMQPGGSQGTASCTWQFGQGSAAPAPPPTLTAQAIPTPGNPATTSPPANNPPGTSTPPPTSARLVSVSPTTMEQGAIGTIVTLTGQGTHWSQTPPTITVSPGIGAPRINSQATSDTELLSSFDVQYGTPPGPRTITVTTGAEVVTLPNAFTVTARARPELLSVTPLRARQGDRNLTVQMTGRNTRWAQGATRVQVARSQDASQTGIPAPMPGVTVVSTTVHSPTSASAVLNVEANAVVGAYWFQVFDAAPSDWLKIVDGFTVEAASTTVPPGGTPPATARLVSVAPGSVEQGVNISDAVTLTGEGTHWQQGTTTVDFGPGVTLQGVVRVNSPTSLTTQFTVSYGAASGPRAVTVTTGNETVTSPNALTITARERPVISQISPDNAAAGAQNVTVTFTGRGTRWEQGRTALLLQNAAGVTQASALSVTSPTSMTVSLNIAPSATSGPREFTVLNSGVVVGSDIITVAGAFTVNPPAPADVPRIVSVTPNVAEQGAVGLRVNLNGQLTHWRNGTPVVSFGPGVSILGQPSVLSAGSVNVLLQVTYAAAPGPRAVTVTAGTEVVSLANALTITARTEPRIESITANSAPVGSQNVPVVFVGSGTRWVQGQTRIHFSGTGIRVVGDPTVDSPTRMTAIFSIDPNATVGVRDVTVLNGGPVIGATIPDDAPLSIASDVLLAPAGFTVSPQALVAVPISPGALPLPTLCTLRGPELLAGANYATPGAAYLDWNAVGGARSYSVSRSDIGAVTTTPLAPANTSYVHVARLSHPGTYVYTVTARYQEGCGSTSISLNSQPPVTPEVYHSLGTLPGQVTLHWAWPVRSGLERVAGDYTGILVTGPALPSAGREIPRRRMDGDHTYIPGVPAGSRTWTVKAFWDTPGGRVIDSTGKTITVVVP